MRVQFIIARINKISYFRHLNFGHDQRVLITGPTGSGKTTTLYSTLKYLFDPKINIITIEDHNPYSGLASQISSLILENNIKIESFNKLGVEEYQLSGKNQELYDNAGISYKSIIELLKKYYFVEKR